MNPKIRIRLLLILLFISFLFGIYAFIKYAFNNKNYKIITEHGDEFNVVYDDFKAKSTVISLDKQSSSSVVLNWKVTKEDFICLNNSSSCKVYRIGKYVLFNDGNGFEVLEKTTDLVNHNNVAKTVITNILSFSSSFFGYNIHFFLEDNNYRQEALRIITTIQTEEYEKLFVYGLTKETVNDSQKLDNIKKAAEEALNEN